MVWPSHAAQSSLIRVSKVRQKPSKRSYRAGHYQTKNTGVRPSPYPLSTPKPRWTTPTVSRATSRSKTTRSPACKPTTLSEPISICSTGTTMTQPSLRTRVAAYLAEVIMVAGMRIRMSWGIRVTSRRLCRTGIWMLWVNLVQRMLNILRGWSKMAGVVASSSDNYFEVGFALILCEEKMSLENFKKFTNLSIKVQFSSFSFFWFFFRKQIFNELHSTSNLMISRNKIHLIFR